MNWSWAPAGRRGASEFDGRVAFPFERNRNRSSPSNGIDSLCPCPHRICNRATQQGPEGDAGCRRQAEMRLPPPSIRALNRPARLLKFLDARCVECASAAAPRTLMRRRCVAHPLLRNSADSVLQGRPCFQAEKMARLGGFSSRVVENLARIGAFDETPMRRGPQNKELNT